jgi:hypothetical protein
MRSRSSSDRASKFNPNAFDKWRSISLRASPFCVYSALRAASLDRRSVILFSYVRSIYEQDEKAGANVAYSEQSLSHFENAPRKGRFLARPWRRESVANRPTKSDG